VRALKRVDLPTLGKPTMPHFRLMGWGFRGCAAASRARWIQGRAAGPPNLSF
jgi:hypothetical protein